MFTVRSTLMWAVLTGQTDWVCRIGTLTLCVEAVAQSCIIVTWWSGSGGIQAWSLRPTGFLQRFDTVGLVIWAVKIIPEMTYYVSSGTLNPTHSLTQLPFSFADFMNKPQCALKQCEKLSNYNLWGPAAQELGETLGDNTWQSFTLSASTKPYKLFDY